MALRGGDDDESPLGLVGTIAAIIIAPIAAMLIQLAVSRQREYLADQTAAELLGEGRPLADALGTLQRGVEALPMAVNPATASLYIANPLGGRGGRGMGALFSTHPPIPVRIEKLAPSTRSAASTTESDGTRAPRLALGARRRRRRPRQLARDGAAVPRPAQHRTPSSRALP